ncbi:MAG: MFS transporter [Bacteroidetes bacterium]|nr:MFS transporter [Bacteroidota bacterium]
METKTTIKLSKYQVLVIILLALTQFTVVLDFMVMSPLGDLLMKSMELTTSQFGFAVLSYGVSAGISGLLTAGFADRYDRKKLLLFFYIGFILGTLFCGLTTSYPMLIAARIVTGIFGGVIGSISMAIVADLFLLEQRGRVMGFMQMGFGASQVLGIPISLYIANQWGWQSPFFMIVGLASLIWLTIVLKIQPINKHLDEKTERNALKHLWNTIKQRDYRIGFSATALLSLGGFMMMPWGTAFAINNLHLTKEQMPSLFMVAGISSLIIMPLIGKLSDKVDKFKLFSAASIWMIIVVLFYTNMTPVPLWVVMIVNVLMMMGIMSRMVPSMALTTSLPEMHDRGAYMSINSSLQQMAGGLAAGVSGLIVFQKTKTSPLEHYDTLGLVMVGISIVCIFMIYRVSKLVAKRAAKAKTL